MEFLWVGNHPGVDLCNTAPVVDGEPVELLAEPADLRRWLRGAAVATASSRPDVATLRWVQDVRDATTAVLLAGSDRRRALRRLNELLATVAAIPQVAADGGLELTATDAQDRIRVALSSLVAEACALDAERVRQCAGEACVLLFFDTSKNGTRRWHDMATCGNRAKVAAHHERTRQASRRWGSSGPGSRQRGASPMR